MDQFEKKNVAKKLKKKKKKTLCESTMNHLKRHNVSLSPFNFFYSKSQSLDNSLTIVISIFSNSIR